MNINLNHVEYTIKPMRVLRFTFNISDYNTIAISYSNENTSPEYSFNNLTQVVDDYERKGFKVVVNLD
jgi:hypothetical protein